MDIYTSKKFGERGISTVGTVSEKVIFHQKEVVYRQSFVEARCTTERGFNQKESLITQAGAKVGCGLRVVNKYKTVIGTSLAITTATTLAFWILGNHSGNCTSSIGIVIKATDSFKLLDAVSVKNIEIDLSLIRIL